MTNWFVELTYDVLITPEIAEQICNDSNVVGVHLEEDKEETTVSAYVEAFDALSAASVLSMCVHLVTSKLASPVEVEVKSAERRQEELPNLESLGFSTEE